MLLEIILLLPIMLIPIMGFVDLIRSRRESQQVLFGDVSKPVWWCGYCYSCCCWQQLLSLECGTMSMQQQIQCHMRCIKLRIVSRQYDKIWWHVRGICRAAMHIANAWWIWPRAWSTWWKHKLIDSCNWLKQTNTTNKLRIHQHTLNILLMMRSTSNTYHARERLKRLQIRKQQAQEANIRWPSTSRQDLIDHLEQEIKQTARQAQLCSQY